MKHKTHKGMKKRIRVSGTGKFMRRRAHDHIINWLKVATLGQD